MRQHRSQALVLAIAVALLVTAAVPARALAGDELPPMPAEQLAPSIHAEMLEANADGSGEPGNNAIGTMSGADDEGGIASADETIALMQPSGEAAATGPGGKLPNGLRKEVLGFLPYWLLGSETRSALRYDLLSTIAYFGIEATPSGGLYKLGTGWNSWNSATMTDVINRAHARGVRVVPTVTMMAWNNDFRDMSTLLNSSTNRKRLIDDIVATIKNRKADGVNIDFEPVPTTLRSQFTTFIRELKTGLNNAKVGSYLTVDTMAGAATWATGYDLAGLTASGAADAVMVMAYDFNWSGSARAGGVAPFRNPYILDVSAALTDHLKLVNPSKIIWGVPYYGRTWPTENNQLYARTCRSTSICPTSKVLSPAGSRAWHYTSARQQAAQHGRIWDSTGQVPWYRWYDSSNATWFQGYYDDAQSLRLKYDLVNNHKLAGIGIWALGMDTGRTELWDAIYRKFVKIVKRVDGPDRYAAAAAVSASSFSPGVSVAVLASGATFPDALAGAPLAALHGGPVLLVTRDQIPEATRTELSRLKPGRVVILGGTASVSAAVASAAAGYTSGSVTRIGGADRYAVAANISAATFGAKLPVAYVTTGEKFPDALAGAAVAARDQGPVLLVRAGSIPAATATELSRLAPGRIVVLGGPASVRDAVRNALNAYTTGSVTRLSGADRYAAAAAISAASFAANGPATVYVATGANFPDALAAAAVAGRRGAPVLLVPSNSLPAVVADELRRLNPATVIVVGGPKSVSSTVLTAIAGLWR